jgi:hypothetical protein
MAKANAIPFMSRSRGMAESAPACARKGNLIMSRGIVYIGSTPAEENYAQTRLVAGPVET